MTDGVLVRLEEHSRRLTEIEKTQPAVTASQVTQLRGEIQDLREEVRHNFTDLRDEVRANKRAQWALASAIVVGALSIALTAIQIAGGG